MLICAALSPTLSPILKSQEKPRVVLAVLASLFIVVLGVRTLMANTDWSSQQARMAADVRDQPDNAIALYHLGTALTEEGQPHLGAPYLEKAVRLKPDSAQARMNLAVAKLLMRDYPSASEHYLAVLNMNPPAIPLFRAQASTALGVIALYERNYVQARQYLSYSLQLRPGHADTLYNLGEALKATANYADALKAYGQALQSQPGHPQATRAMNELQKALSRQQQP
jgi:tetratricopeptide (TPR) repeat protein